MNCSAKTLQELYTLYLEHRRKDTVASHLNKHGYRTKRGKEWNGIAVGRILEQTEWLDIQLDADRRRAKPEVSRELFDKVQALLRLQKSSKISGKSPTHLFAGRVKCHCGSTMYKANNSPKYTCKSCRNKIPSEDLEKIFLSQLKPFIRHSEAIKLAVGKWDNLPFQAKYQIVDTILEDVVIQKDDNVELLFSYNPFSKDAGNSQHCEYPTNSEKIIQAAETGEWDEDTVQAVLNQASMTTEPKSASPDSKPSIAQPRPQISTKEAAAILGYHPKTILKNAQKWGLSKIYMGKTSVFFYRHEIAKLAKDRTSRTIRGKM
jgi:hypothetical protein